MSDAKALQTSPTENQFSPSGNPPIGTVTSSFFVSIDKVFAHTSVEVETVKESVQLLWFTSIEERPSIGNMTSDFQASATLIHSLLEMHVLTDSAMPILRENMRNNTPIKKIIISRVGHLGKDKHNKLLYSSTFENCFLEAVEEFPDKLIIKARITKRTDKAAATDYTNTQKGNTVSGWDYAKNQAV
ncbi:MAG: hypothetical protein K2Y18_06635 [Alphaproteobacteria bacterium]|jgi:hypothetical protein|nr:hypothetical protein [Alphaproteobacteria bacterium]